MVVRRDDAKAHKVPGRVGSSQLLRDWAHFRLDKAIVSTPLPICSGLFLIFAGGSAYQRRDFAVCRVLGSICQEEGERL